MLAWQAEGYTNGIAESMADEAPLAHDAIEAERDRAELMAVRENEEGGRSGRKWWILGAVVSVVVAALIALGSINSHWVAFRPGSAAATDDKVDIAGVQSYEPIGEVLFLTVSVDRLSVLEHWLARYDDDVELRKESEVYPKSRQETRQENAALMTQSKSNAELVALTHLGYEVFERVGVAVSKLADDAPAKGVLTAGDTIVAFDGVATKTYQSLVTELRRTKPGQVVRLDVERADASKGTVEVTLGAHAEGHGMLGAFLSDRVREKPDLPVQITIDSGRIGGNSAGLAFTLAILDELTPGELTGGKKVAVTGAIDLDGTVQPIGGVEQKVVAARRAGAELMLVPKADEASAIAKASGKLRIVAVTNLKEALDVLASVGGNANDLPKVTPPL